MKIKDCIKFCISGKNQVAHAKKCMRNYVSFDDAQEVRDFCKEMIATLNLLNSRDYDFSLDAIKRLDAQASFYPDPVTLNIKYAERMFGEMADFLICLRNEAVAKH